MGSNSDLDRILDENDSEIVDNDGGHTINESHTPPDKYNFVYLLFCLMGMCTIIPWSFFLTCNNYWMYKLEDRNTKIHHNSKDQNRTMLQTEFLSYVTIVSSVPVMIYQLFFYIYIVRKCCINNRITVPLVATFLLFITTTALVPVDTRSWKMIFMYITLTTVFLINVLSIVLQGALFEMVSRFPTSYVAVYLSGQSLSGILAAITQVATLPLSHSVIVTTLSYFSFADIFILCTLICYVFAKRTIFFKYYFGENNYRPLQQNRSVTPIITSDSTNASVGFLVMIKKIWTEGVSAMICCWITSSVCPSLVVLVCSTSKTMSSLLPGEYFVAVITYLLWNLCDYIGRIVAGFLKKPSKNGSCMLLICNLLRIGLIPILMLCNEQPRHYMPVIITSDYVYTFIVIVAAFSNGYLLTTSFLLVSRFIPQSESNMASFVLITYVGAGFTLGSLTSLLVISII